MTTTDTTNRDQVSILRDLLENAIHYVEDGGGDTAPMYAALAAPVAAIQPAGDAYRTMLKYAVTRDSLIAIGELARHAVNDQWADMSSARSRFKLITDECAAAVCKANAIPLAAPLAQASKDAEAGELPPLPKCKMLSGPALDSLHVLYTADQMHTYARAALARQSAPSAVSEADTFGLCMLVAEAAWRAGSGWSGAVASDKLREVVNQVFAAAPTTATSSKASAPAAPDMSVRDAACQLLDDLIKLWDAESVSEDDHNEELCRIEDAIRTLRSAPIGADQGAKDAD